MKIKRIVPFYAAILLLFVFWGCNLGQQGEGDAPTIGMSIPEALRSDSRGISRAVSGGAAEVFEPFRNALELGQEAIDIVNNVIDIANKVSEYDTYEGTLTNGDKGVVSTDASRSSYTKRIEFFKPDGTRYFQVSYNSGVDKGLAVFDVAVYEPASEIDMAEIFYDGTTDPKVLHGKVTFVDQEAAAAEEIFPRSIYFNAAETGGIVTLDGGVVYNYFLGENSVDNPNDVVEDRAYMFKAFGQTAGEEAIVELYFPLVNDAATDTVLSTDDALSTQFLEIIQGWAHGNRVNVNSIGNQLDAYSAGAPNGPWTFWNTDPSEFVDMLDDIQNSGNGSDDLEAILFVLALDNPIAYNVSVTDGYVANGPGNVGSEYTSLGDLSTIDFSLSPWDIRKLTFDFLE